MYSTVAGITSNSDIVALKPNDMSESQFQCLIIAGYNRYGDNIIKLRKYIKVHTAINKIAKAIVI